jgi:hypothetical protein
MSSRETRQKARTAAIAHRADRLPLRLARAWYAANLALPDGFPSGTGENVSGGGISRPVENAVIAREHTLDSTIRNIDGTDIRIPRGMTVVDEQLRVIEAAFTMIELELSQIEAPLTRKDAPARTNISECEACGRTVAGTPTDRLRSGYCDACRKAWDRAGRPDRVQFQRARHCEVSAADHSKTFALDRDTAGVDVWSAGVTVTLTGEHATEYRALQAAHGKVPAEEVRRLVNTILTAAHNTATIDR